MSDMALPDIRRGYATALMVISSIMISFGGLLIRLMEEADVWQIMVYRSAALIFVISLIMVAQFGTATPATVRAIGRPGLLAGVLMAGATFSFLQSITNTSVANTLFMLSGIPFFTAALARVILKEPLTRNTLITMICASVGMVVMVAGGIGTGSLYGNLMGLVTALCFSGYAIIVRRHRGVEMQPVLLVAGVLVLAVSLMVTWRDLAIPLHDIFLCFLLGGVLSGGANLMFIIAARHIAAAELTIFMLLEFALGPLWVWMVLNEVPRAATLIGGAIVIGAVGLRALTELQRTQRRPPSVPL